MDNRSEALREQMDKRLSAMGNHLKKSAKHIDRFVVWFCSTTTMASRGLVITVWKPWPPGVPLLAGRSREPARARKLISQWAFRAGRAYNRACF